MKNNYLIIAITLIIFLFVKTSYSQDTLIDPYETLKSYTTFDLGVSATRINTTNVDFGQYTLIKNRYYPTINSGIFINSNHKFDKDLFLNIKGGMLFNNNYTDLTDSIGTELRFSEFNISIPLMIGTHLPINYNKPTDNYFKSIDINFGGFIGFPMFPILDNKNNIDSQADEMFSDYIKYGFIAEIIFSSLNKDGYGQRIGMRVIADAKNVIKNKEEKYGIYPTYITIGIFYNFLTLK